MTEDIEARLSVVFKALKGCDPPAAEVIAWCMAMLANNCVQLIAREELQSAVSLSHP